MRVVEIDQILHGYSEGHRLLAGSRRLSGESQRAMRMLSDLSGPRLVQGFADYLTGYILSDEKLFCLARTWYATECDRPGCVWTHSLLLASHDLNQLNDLEFLLPLFRRPSLGLNGDLDLEHYELPLSTTVPSFTPSTYAAVSFAAETLIECLYGTTGPVVIPDDDSSQLQSLHFAMWRQAQRLARVTLQFCTGAIQPRVAAYGQFDVQTVPRGSLREIVRTNKNITVCLEKDNGPKRSWVRMLFDDLHQRTSDFRLFFHRYGESLSRPAIGAHARIYAAIYREFMPYDQLLKMISSEFPSKTEARILKAAVAGATTYRELSEGVTEELVLTTLLQVPGTAFDAEALNVRDRFSELWHHSEFSAIRVANSALLESTPISDEICDELYALVAKDGVKNLIAYHQNTVILLLSRKPQLLTHPDIWSDASQVVIEAIGLVSSAKSLPESDVFQIVTCQLQARTVGVAELMVSRFPTIAAEAVLHWLQEEIDRLAPLDWRTTLGNATEMADWLKGSLSDCKKAATLIRFVSPASALIQALSPEDWLVCADRCSGSKDNGVYALLCCLGLDRSDEFGPALLSKSFGVLYEMAERGEVQDVVWQSVAERLPAAGWWWDRCRQMRTGLVTKFASAKWSPVSFIRCLPNARMFSDVVQMWGWEQNERDFLAVVLNQIASGAIEASDEFIKISQRYAPWF